MELLQESYFANQWPVLFQPSCQVETVVDVGGKRFSQKRGTPRRRLSAGTYKAYVGLGEEGEGQEIEMI